MIYTDGLGRGVPRMSDALLISASNEGLGPLMNISISGAEFSGFQRRGKRLIDCQFEGVISINLLGVKVGEIYDSSRDGVLFLSVEPTKSDLVLHDIRRANGERYLLGRTGPALKMLAESFSKVMGLRTYCIGLATAQEIYKIDNGYYLSCKSEECEGSLPSSTYFPGEASEISNLFELEVTSRGKFFTVKYWNRKANAGFVFDSDKLEEFAIRIFATP